MSRPAADTVPAPRERLASASQWRLVWLRFCRHRLAVAAALMLTLLCLTTLLCEFVAPYGPEDRDVRSLQAPPQRLRFIDAAGRFHLRPFAYGHSLSFDAATWERVYAPDPQARFPLRLLARGERYRMWGLFESDLHLFGPGEGGYLHLFGTDKLGRDLFSRVLYGGRISLTIGLVGVALTFVFGVVLGGFAGYYGGWTDTVTQRLIEVIQCIPQLPLWMALSASLPPDWSGLKVY